MESFFIPASVSSLRMRIEKLQAGVLQGEGKVGFDLMKRFDNDLSRNGMARRFLTKINRGMNLREGENELD